MLLRLNLEASEKDHLLYTSTDSIPPTSINHSSPKAIGFLGFELNHWLIFRIIWSSGASALKTILFICILRNLMTLKDTFALVPLHGKKFFPLLFILALVKVRFVIFFFFLPYLHILFLRSSLPPRIVGSNLSLGDSYWGPIQILSF